MIDFGNFFTLLSHNGNHVEAPMMNPFAKAYVMVDSPLYILLFLIVDGAERVGEQLVMTCLYFHEYKTVMILCNDVDVAMLGVPVALKYHVALLTQIGRR